jgi:hypothetical protein
VTLAEIRAATTAGTRRTTQGGRSIASPSYVETCCWKQAAGVVSMVASECDCEVCRGPRSFVPPSTSSFGGSKKLGRHNRHVRGCIHHMYCVNFTRPASYAVSDGHAVQRASRNGRVHFLCQHRARSRCVTRDTQITHITSARWANRLTTQPKVEYSSGNKHSAEIGACHTSPPKVRRRLSYLRRRMAKQLPIMSYEAPSQRQTVRLLLQR